MLRNFTYTDSKGKVTRRVAYMIKPASPNNLAIDLTEFNEEEQAVFNSALNEIGQTIEEFYKTELKALGLSNNYRMFKPEGMQE